MKSVLTILLSALVLSGCYHATVETGQSPSPQTLEKQWAHSWIYGLVPPSTVETMERCPSGVARVETQLSFANQLVGFLTGGIYTPMSIVVTCAAEGSEDKDMVYNPEDWNEAIESGEPFLMSVQ